MKQRIKIFCNYLQIPVSEFERRCNMSNGYVSAMRRGIGYDKLKNVLKEFPQLNREWLLYGEGEMLKECINVSADNGSAATAVGDATVNSPSPIENEFISLLKKKDEQIDQLINIIKQQALQSKSKKNK